MSCYCVLIFSFFSEKERARAKEAPRGVGPRAALSWRLPPHPLPKGLPSCRGTDFCPGCSANISVTEKDLSFPAWAGSLLEASRDISTQQSWGMQRGSGAAPGQPHGDCGSVSARHILPSAAGGEHPVQLAYALLF